MYQPALWGRDRLHPSALPPLPAPCNRPKRRKFAVPSRLGRLAVPPLCRERYSFQSLSGELLMIRSLWLWRNHCARRPSPCRARLRLELLEDRIVPDTTAGPALDLSGLLAAAQAAPTVHVLPSSSVLPATGSALPPGFSPAQV